METRALACCMEQQTIPAQKHSETKITSFRPQCATKVLFEKCRNWCPNVSHKNLSSSKSEHRSIYSSSFQTLQWRIWITAAFFFFQLDISKYYLVFYLHPLLISTLRKIRGCRDAQLHLFLQLKWLQRRWNRIHCTAYWWPKTCGTTTAV